MKILGIDTSCEQASCALYIDGAVVEKRSEADKRKHSTTVMPMTDILLKEAGIKIKEIDIYAVSSGPGSFTGLRIGMAAIKGMAFAAGKNITVIKTPDVLANYFSESEDTICPLIDARNNQVYTALYKWKDGLFRIDSEYMGIKIGELAEILRGAGKVNFCGDASGRHYDFFKESGVSCKEPDPEHKYPSAAVLVGMVAAGAGETVAATEVVPFYLRVSQAERFHGK